MGNPITLEEIINFLLEAPMFCDLDASELSQIVHIMQVQPLRPDQYAFREGEAGDAWYVLFEGAVEVLKDSGTGNDVIVTLEPPACFGEMAILDGSPRSASVRAVTDATAFRFPRKEFAELLEAGNLAAYKLVHQIALVLVHRQRQTTSRLVDVLQRRAALEVRDQLEPIVTESTPSE